MLRVVPVAGTAIRIASERTLITRAEDGVILVEAEQRSRRFATAYNKTVCASALTRLRPPGQPPQAAAANRWTLTEIDLSALRPLRVLRDGA